MNWQETLSYLNPWRNSQLETYILKTCIAMFGSALLVVSSLIFLIDYIGISKSLEGNDELSGVTVIGLILQKSPSSILVLLPFAFLFGSIFAFVTLNRRSELIAMRAAGVSAWRFVMPATALAFAIGVITIGALNPIASLLQENYDKTTSRIRGSAPQSQNTGVYLRQGEAAKQTVIRAERGDPDTGRLEAVTFWNYDLDPRGTPRFASRVDAQSAVLKPGFWELRNARETKPGEQPLYYEQLSLPSNLDANAAFRRYVSTQSVPFWQLPGLIQRNMIAGSPTTQYQLRLHQLLSTPVMFAAMAMLGAVFSLRLMRLGGLTPLVISGVSLGFVVFFVNQLFSSMGKADVIPVELAGWSPAVLALLAAMTLLVYTEDG